MSAPEPAPRRKLTRRALLLRVTVLAVPVIAASQWETNRIIVTRHRVTLAGLPTGLRVVQLSDLHRGWLVSEEMIRRAAAVAMAQMPDVVALTGDFVSRGAAHIDSCVRALSGLRARYGVWCVPGNHDYWTRDIGRIMRRLRGAGFRVLVNENGAAGPVQVVGLDDTMAGRPDAARAFAGVAQDVAVLTLMHNPCEVKRILERRTVALCGHTHGGQVWFPGRHQTMPSSDGYVSGWYRKGRARMYVNRGIGVVGLPLRVMAPPEVSVFEFVPEGGGRQA